MRLLPIILFIFNLLCYSCKTDTKKIQASPTDSISELNITYANGFTITQHDNYRHIKVTAPWPEAKDTLHYILYPKNSKKPKINIDATFIGTPVQSVVVTSTTDIPMLEVLEIDSLLVGFPQTQYISSEKTRKRVIDGKVTELGNEQNINVEALLELNPNLVIGFSTTGQNATYELLKKSGIPVVINGSWLEQHPLGRTEWIRFIASFFHKEDKAKTVFNTIKKEYKTTADKVKALTKKATILPGSLFKDVWYVPGGDSYMAKFYKDASLSYAWAQTKQTGSLSLSIEEVLDKAQDADIWITTKTLSSLKELYEENSKYELFTAFENKNVYSTFNKGSGSGTDFYELGSLRPDLILKDLIKIGHPGVLPDYDLYFFKQLNQNVDPK
ncbi:ABC transporter substrate-binding protein [Aquimarina sp. ERC-38]|uniref:ABC transporter substrate-binding protein n=1 Tax=Aquimarina sp. ERC-38 TaxID=2949996 RepID=UPI002247DE4A|nr:ABC transporter substrate-binding protein [Aquimarina sp. ERC-38]UZO80778.1 ABC transporter substrate-binding protein [Aquimarina sp. ERC-38]